MKVKRLLTVSVFMASLFIITPYSYAASAYTRFGLDCGSANDTVGALVDLAFSGISESGLGAGIDLSFANKMGYEYDPAVVTGDSRHLNFLSICPEIQYMLMPSWPVNISLSVDGGPGWIGVEDEINSDNTKLNDAILIVKGRAAINFLFWNGAGFYIGGNYTRVYRSQNTIFTNKELRGFEISFGLTGYFSGMAQ